MDLGIILTALGTVATIAGVLYAFLHNFKQEINKKFDRIDLRFENMQFKLDERFDWIDREIKEIRTSVNRLEGAFYNQECCVVKEKKPRKKAE